MATIVHRIFAAAAVLMLTASIAHAAETTTVKVALLDMTAMFSRNGDAPGYGPGMMGPGSGPGMMDRYGYGPGMRYGDNYGRGMMGPGMFGPGGPGMMGHGMMAIRTTQASVSAGKVILDVTNYSRSIEHEMLVVAVDSPGAALPYDYNAWRVIEDRIKVVGEAEPELLQPGATTTLELTLAPGSYLLICNLPGHFAAGMATTLTVTAN